MNNEIELKENNKNNKELDFKKVCKKKAKQYLWISIGVILMDIGYYFFFSNFKTY